jgi:signal transduction histidine kinase
MRRSWIGTAVLAALAVSVWLFVVALPRAFHGPLWTLGALVGTSFLAAGTVAWRLHPHNRVGPLMAAVGIAWIPQQMLITSGEQPLFPVWLALCGLWAALACHLFLAFPAGRLGRVSHRVVAGAAYAEAVVFPASAVTVRAEPAGPLAPIAAFVGESSWQAVIVTGVAILGLALARWREGSAAHRRAIAPVVVASAIATVAFVADLLVNQWGPRELGLPVAVTMFCGFAAVPLAYLGSLARHRIDRGRVADLVVRLRGRKRSDGLESALAATLHDPTLRVGYWMPGQDGYVDAEGEPVERPPTGSGRVMTRVDQEGARLAVLVHDEALLEQPLLVEAACAAAALALENERLTADLRARVRQLAASRARMLQWGEAERRRIERDLHDGVQQRLLSVAMTLGLAEATAERAKAGALIGEAKAAVLAALDDLRAVSHGIHPPVLTERGLSGAVKELAAVSPVAVECVLDMVEPLPPAVESAAYYIVNEALANVTKHARARRAWVRLARGDGHLLVEVGDDGRGGADPARGSGLEGLAHRAEANGGRLELDSREGKGTVLRVTLPCE